MAVVEGVLLPAAVTLLPTLAAAVLVLARMPGLPKGTFRLNGEPDADADCACGVSTAAAP